MCGRFTNRLTWRELVALYRLTVPAEPERNLPARYNICPTTTIDAVVERGGTRELVGMRWGLVPSWWNKPLKKLRLATFNARAETVAEKPMFRAAFKRNRCLIPVSGYYEWTTTPDGKQPYYFSTENGSPLTIAGLWDEWNDIETGEPLKSCTMIITAANEFVSKIHDRMPALLTPFQFDAWLAGSAGLELLVPWSQRSLQTWPVSRRVNSSRTPSDDPTLIDRVAA
jgi:putative SOS response-associated peptidase YedK